jgi:hypothetical protein
LQTGRAGPAVSGQPQLKRSLYQMKKLFLIAAAVAAFSAPALATGTKYPPGTSKQAIAIDQAVKAEIAGKPDVVFCALIDTKTGACRQLLVLDAGGGGGGGE